MEAERLYHHPYMDGIVCLLGVNMSMHAVSEEIRIVRHGLA
jgi:hypothetical protein